MKKLFFILLTLILTLSLFISCNDGEEGLFQMAANSVKKESFKILNIINKESDDVYIVATDNGIAKYNVVEKSFSNFKGTGVQAANAIWAKENGGEFVYYNPESDKYFNQNNEEITDDSLKVKDLTPQPFYTVDGVQFTYVFKDDEGHFYSQYMDSSPASYSDIDPTSGRIVIMNEEKEEDIVSVSIIGNGILRVKTSKNYYIYEAYDADSESVSYHIVDNIIQGISDSGLYITTGGVIYDYHGINEKELVTEVSINRRPAMFNTSFTNIPGDEVYTYIIPEGYSSVFVLKRDKEGKVTKATKTVTGLQNINVIAIIGKEDNKLTILTANNGVQEIELK